MILHLKEDFNLNSETKIEANHYNETSHFGALIAHANKCSGKRFALCDVSSHVGRTYGRADGPSDLFISIETTKGDHFIEKLRYIYSFLLLSPSLLSYHLTKL